MKKLLIIFAIICIASIQAQTPSPCPWDYLSTLGGLIMGTQTPFNLCNCYESGLTLVQTVLEVVQVNQNNVNYASIFMQTTNITQLVTVVLADCGISTKFFNILPDVCIDDLETIAYTGEVTLQDLQGTDFPQMAIDIPALYCAVANATITCPFLNDYYLPLGTHCQCFFNASVVLEESITLYQAVQQNNNANIQSAVLSLSWMIPEFLSSCNIAQINLLNQQCINYITMLYSEALQLSNDVQAQNWDAAVIDLPALYCLYENTTMACPFMQEYAWNPIQVSCQCYAYGLQVFYDLQSIYTIYLQDGNFEFLTQNMVSLMAILPNTFNACGIQYQLLDEACVLDLETLYNQAVTLWSQRENMAEFAINFPGFICTLQTASQDCPFLSKLI